MNDLIFAAIPLYNTSIDYYRNQFNGHLTFVGKIKI